MIELRPGDPRYPVLLGAIPAPPALFARGALSDDDALALAIVGSRRPTPYGLAVAERLAPALACWGGAALRGAPAPAPGRIQVSTANRVTPLTATPPTPA